MCPQNWHKELGPSCPRLDDLHSPTEKPEPRDPAAGPPAFPVTSSSASVGPWGPSPQVTRRRHQRNSTAFNKPEDHLLYKARLPVLLKLTPQPPTLRLSLGPPCSCPTQLRKDSEQLRQDAQESTRQNKPGSPPPQARD